MDQVAALAGQFGPMGLIIGYLIVREARQERLAEKHIEATNALARALALLDATIRGGHG